MPYKIDRFNFNDQTVENFNRVGITPDKIEGWITDGRKNGISDEGIREFIIDQYNDLNEPYMRGRTTGDAIRYAVHSTVPVLGKGIDELEAAIKSGSFFSGSEYEKQHRDIEDRLNTTKQIFKENTKDGGWFTRNITHNVPEIGNIINESLLAVGTGGATLMPKTALMMGATEGFLGGNNPVNRSVNAALLGGTRYALSSLLNKVFPTKEVSEQTVKKAAEGTIVGNKKPYENVIAKTIESGKEPVAVIAEESTRGTEPAIMKNLQMALKGNDKQAKIVYDSALRNVDYKGGFVQYMKDRMPVNLSDKVKDRLSKGFETLENSFESVANNTDDVLVKENLPQMIDSVINFAMRGAEKAERAAVKNAAIKAFSERHFAKEIAKKLIPQNMIGNIGNQASMIRPDRIITRPLSQALNTGTLNTMTNTLPGAGSFITDKIIRPSVTTATRPVIDNAILKALGY